MSSSSESESMSIRRIVPAARRQSHILHRKPSSLNLCCPPSRQRIQLHFRHRKSFRLSVSSAHPRSIAVAATIVSARLSVRPFCAQMLLICPAKRDRRAQLVILQTAQQGLNSGALPSPYADVKLGDI